MAYERFRAMFDKRLDELGWSQAEFSRRTRVRDPVTGEQTPRISQTAVNYWFNSDSRPSPDSLKVISDITGLNLDALMAACGYGSSSVAASTEPDELRPFIRSIAEAYPQATVKDQEWTRSLLEYISSALAPHETRTDRRRRSRKDRKAEPPEAPGLRSKTYRMLATV